MDPKRFISPDAIVQHPFYQHTPKTKNQSARTGFCFSRHHPSDRLCARGAQNPVRKIRGAGGTSKFRVCSSAPLGHEMALFVRMARFCFAIFGPVKYLVSALSCGTFLQKLSYNVTGTPPNMIRQGDYYGTIYQSGPIVI